MTNLKENKINLQLFATKNEGVEGTKQDNQDTSKDTTDTKETETVKTYTQEEVEKMLQAEADKRVSSALSKKEKEYQAQLEEEQRKANLSKEELQAEKERELAEREEQIKQFELKLKKIDYFKEKGYDMQLSDYVSGSDEKEIQANSDSLIAIIDKVVESKITEKLKESAYSSPKNQETSKGITKEDFAKMGYAERVKLSTENPELYKELSK